MTLQGGLDSFPLPDVLRLLAATGKTGGLHVVGPTASGSIWVVDGRIEHTALGGEACDPAETVFALLRNVEGTFRYEAGVPDTVPPASHEGPDEMDAVLAAAALLLQEWDELGLVVPGADARLHLRPELERPVRLAPEEWAVIVAIGDGTCVHDLALALRVPEIVAMRRARDLVLAGLLVASPADPYAAPVRMEDLMAAARPLGDVEEAPEHPRPVASALDRPVVADHPEPIVPGTLDAEDWADADAAVLSVWGDEHPWSPAEEDRWDAGEPWGVEPSWDAASTETAIGAWTLEAWSPDGVPRDAPTSEAWSPAAAVADPGSGSLSAALLPSQPSSSSPAPTAAATSAPDQARGEEGDREIDRSLLLRFLGAVED